MMKNVTVTLEEAVADWRATLETAWGVEGRFEPSGGPELPDATA